MLPDGTVTIDRAVAVQLITIISDSFTADRPRPTVERHPIPAKPAPPWAGNLTNQKRPRKA